MYYYSSNKIASSVSLQEAGKRTRPTGFICLNHPTTFIRLLQIDSQFRLTEIAKTVAKAFFCEDIPKKQLDEIVRYC